MVAKISTATILGLNAIPVDVEVDVASSGLPSLTIVGLPDKGIQEARDRVKSALVNSGCDVPAKKITINLSPSDIPKKGSGFDLPIAIGMLVGLGSLAQINPKILFIGELSLDGEIKPTQGILPAVIMAKKMNYRCAVIPPSNAREASIIDGIEILSPKNISELVLHLSNIKKITPVKTTNLPDLIHSHHVDIDLSDIIGQQQAKRALEIAAAGGHNIFFYGTPGAGKTMLARALPGILPILSPAEALELTNIYSVAGELPDHRQIVSTRPFRNPHHTTSKAGIIGGGTFPKPGEITLAHRGVLFLDELPEFPRNIIESLRQPLEDGVVQITRANQTVRYPSKCMLVAAANPCPCGYYSHPQKACRCTLSQINNYQKKISGPILDRIDIHVQVAPVNIRKLTHQSQSSDRSIDVQSRVQSAHQIQTARFKQDSKNAYMTNKQINEYCLLDAKTQSFLTTAAQKLHLSARSYYKTLKVARTIADLAGVENISYSHVAEALQYRNSIHSQ